MKKKSTSQSAPARRSPGEGGFFNLRILLASVFCLAGVFIALLGFGAFSAQAQQNHSIINQSIDPLVPAMFDCSKIHELGIDKQENMRAGAIMIYCGEAQGGAASPGHSFSRLVQTLLSPWHMAPPTWTWSPAVRFLPMLPSRKHSLRVTRITSTK